MQNKLRIIGGDWRSRQVLFDDAPGLRPTPARVRETLFNWLHYDLLGHRCLDLYAGSGALGFEAASRGAKQVVLVEQNPTVCRCLKSNADKLAATQIQIVQTDAFRYLAGNAEPFDVVFIDPPFSLGVAAQSCHWLEDKGWLSPHAKIYVESASNVPLTDLPTNWQVLKSKVAGEVAYQLFGRNEGV
ncbi:16S rRNA (guanine(966)-N(2))-methyltransferase RsmD [Methylovulum psychrotolerans]|uniref:16S rRNA (guanine(966)-N(2))-methyltransferase RsmD n=1 Tax=Methylovulum psychrotolerans TaxID=1704499 RepID=UPI001BFF5ADE|nr:16S rRNA (guanine(966)-N(2))-methyltransferase RsmD [Methylovulum psychrotolerans]